MKKLAFLLAMFALPAFMCGCGADDTSEAGHDDHGEHDDHAGHDDHEEGGSSAHNHGDDFPKDLEEAVAEIAELADTIKGAYEREDVAAADGSIHDIGHILGHVDGWTDESELSDDDKKAMKEAGEALFGIYQELHGEQHGADGVDYGSVSMKIEENVAIMKSKLSAE